MDELANFYYKHWAFGLSFDILMRIQWELETLDWLKVVELSGKG
jgi:hypothetical protein